DLSAPPLRPESPKPALGSQKPSPAPRAASGAAKLPAASLPPAMRTPSSEVPITARGDPLPDVDVDIHGVPIPPRQPVFEDAFPMIEPVLETAPIRLDTADFAAIVPPKPPPRATPHPPPGSAGAIAAANALARVASGIGPPRSLSTPS